MKSGDFMRRLLGVSLLTLVLRMATMVSKLLLTLAMARLMAPTDVGTYGLVVAILSIAVVLVGVELYTQGNRELVLLTPEGRVRLIRDQFGFYLFTYTAAALVAAGTALAGWMPPRLVAVLMVLVVLDHLSQECFRVLIYLSRTVSANLVLFLRAGAWTYAAIALMLLEPAWRGVEPILALWAIGALAGVGLALFSVRDLPWAAAFPIRGSWEWIGGSLVGALPFIVTAAAAIASIYVDRFFLDVGSGRDILGVYTLFSSFALAILSLVTATVSQQFLPRLVAVLSDGRRARHSIIRAFLLANVGATILLAGCSLLAIHPLLALIGRPEYTENIWIFSILVGAMALRAVADVPAGVLYGLRADRRLMAANLLALGTSLVGNAALVPTWGIAGAAWTACVASAVLLSTEWWLAHRMLREVAACART